MELREEVVEFGAEGEVGAGDGEEGDWLGWLWCGGGIVGGGG